MNITGKQSQIVFECLVMTIFKPPWLHVRCNSRVLDKVVTHWPNKELDAKSLELVGDVLNGCADAGHSDSWDQFVSGSQAEVKTLAAMWAKLVSGEELPTIPEDEQRPDAAALFDRACQYEQINGALCYARLFWERALDAARDQGQKELAACCLTRMAQHDLMSCDTKNARERITEARKLLQRSKNAAVLGEAILTDALVRSDCEERINPADLEKGIELVLEVKEWKLAADGLVILAEVAGQPSLEHLNQAIDLYRKAEAFLSVARTTLKVAQAQMNRDQIDESLGSVQQAIEMLADIRLNRNARADEARCVELRGDILRKAGRTDDAQLAYQESISMFKSLEHGRARQVERKIHLMLDHETLTPDPLPESDTWLTGRASRKRRYAKSDVSIGCDRGKNHCGRCGGTRVRAIFYTEDSGNVWTNYSCEYLCNDCGWYTTWDYED